MIAKEKKDRDRVAEFEKARSIVNDHKIVRAYGYIQTYCGIVKDHEMDIQNSKGDPTKIRELVPFVESIIWGCQKLNLSCIMKLSTFLFNTFGSLTVAELQKGTFVLKEIRDCFMTLNPTDNETKRFLADFCQRNCIDIESLNDMGHSIKLDENGELIIEPDTQEITIITGQTATTVKVQQIGSNTPGGNPYPQNGGYPQQQMGYQQQQPGFPQQNQGFPQQQIYPQQQQQTTYPQQQMGFQQPQNGYPQNQMNYPQQQFGFQQQQPIMSPTGTMPGYQQYQPTQQVPNQGQYTQPGYSPTQNQQQFPGTNNQNAFFPSPYPNFNNIKDLNAKPTSTGSNGINSQSSLDDFNQRMKNIKEGL